jgi:hypothetical protein
MRVVKEIAFGGCSLNLSPSISIIGHDHLDHIPISTSILVVGPIRRIHRTNVLYVHYDEYTRITVNGRKITVFVCGRKTLKTFGLENIRLHTNPILIQDGQEIAIYVDDIDVKDVEPLKRFIENLKKAYKDDLTTALFPVYNRNNAHGAKDYKELHDKAFELLEHAHSLGLEVYALAHPVIPHDLPNFAKPIPKIIKTMKF